MEKPTGTNSIGKPKPKVTISTHWTPAGARQFIRDLEALAKKQEAEQERVKAA